MSEIEKEIGINYIFGWGARPFGKKQEQNNGFIVAWGRKNWGFGEFTFAMKDGKIVCDNECMSKQFIKDVLCALVDECELVHKEPD